MHTAVEIPADSRIAALRSLLAEKFPHTETKAAGVLATGLEVFDASEGGLRRGCLTEITGASSAGTLFIETMLHVLRREKCFGALIDGGHSFDPQGCHPHALRRLLWVQCPAADSAIKAADLLLRDGNLALILLDLQMLAARELRRIPANAWHRFQRVVEQTGIAFTVLTPQPMVEGARVRIAVTRHWDLQAMRQRRRALLGELTAQIFTRASAPMLVAADVRRRALHCETRNAECEKEISPPPAVGGYVA